MNRHRTQSGFSLVEVMMAMVISGVAVMGTLGAINLSSRHIHQGHVSTHALALAQSRLEAKRSVRWDMLLTDDLDHDGLAEVIMKDDGQGPDRVAGDRIYTAAQRDERVTVVWTVELDRPGPMAAVAIAMIRATAFYEISGAAHEISLASLRANPAFVGSQ